MIKKLLVLLIALTGVSANCQISYQNGYYVTNAGEKIVGKIKDVDWRNNPSMFEFIASDGAEVKIVSMNEASEFGIDNVSKYVRSTVNIDRSSEKVAELSTDKNPVFKEEMLFLKVLVEGGADLYEYYGDSMVRFFYSINDGPKNQLVYKSYYRQSDNMIIKNNYYRQQLLNDLKCDAITLQKMEKLKYQRTDLVGIFTDYNKCSNSAYEVFQKEKKAGGFNLSLRPRLNSSSFKVEHSTSDDRDMDFGASTTYAFGIEAEFILGFNNGKWGIIVEPTYQQYKASKTVNSSSVSGGKLVGSVDYSSIEIPVGVRHYFFLNDSSKLFVNVSAIYDVAFESDITFRRDNGTVLGKLEVSTRTNLGIGAGYKYKDRYSVELRAMSKRNLVADYEFWESNYSAMSLIIGYSIF